MPFMYCDPPSRIVQIRQATDRSLVGSGLVTLRSGASFHITVGSSTDPTPEADFVVKMRGGDRIQLCYAPSQRNPNLPPSARMAVVGDLENAAYMYALSMPARREPASR